MAKTENKANAPEVEGQSQTPEQTASTSKPQTLAAKILLAKSKIGVITKDAAATVDSKTGKKVQYATLSTVLGAITPVLTEFGVDYVVTPILSELAVSLIPQNIRIFSLHFVDVESGEVSEPICYPFRMATNYDAIKADGSTITYATRYLLGMALGLQTEEDPDAKFNNNGGKKQPQQPQQPTQPQPKKRTFEECKNGFYTVYNQGNIEGAKKTLDYVLANWGNDPEHAEEIKVMQTVDLSSKTANDKPPF